jgi:S1-C subfamily serine protease
MATPVYCPECDHKLNLSPATLLKPSAKVRCPSCEAVVTVGSKAPPPAPRKSTAIAPKRPPRRQVLDDEIVEELEEVKETRSARKSVKRRDDEDEEAPRRSSRNGEEKSNTPLIVGLSVGGVALLGLAITLVLVLRKGKDTTTDDKPDLARNDTPVKLPDPNRPDPIRNPNQPDPNRPDPNRPDPNQPDPNPVNPPNGNEGPETLGGLSRVVLNRVKAATVMVRVTLPGGRSGTGSGFFEVTSGCVMTNAHVLNMLERGNPPPQKIDIVINSGQGPEKERVVPVSLGGVDRLSDLALLRLPPVELGGAPYPPGLTVTPAKTLQETQKVYVLGFPFGEQLGKNITVSESSVTSLRTDAHGDLSQVQVNGGMNPGNSGGPVVDARGNVVGVAVSIIKGTGISFAIPGERVHSVLAGRLSEINVTEAIQRDTQLVVQVTVVAIDPQKRIQHVSLQWWYGNPGEKVPPSATPPVPAPNAPRTNVEANYNADNQTATAELVLPALPQPGQVLWVQPAFVNATGQAAWTAGVARTLEQPPEPRTIDLVLRPQLGRVPLELKSKATFRLKSSDGESHSLMHNIETKLTEETRQVTPQGLSSSVVGVNRFEIGRSIDGKGPPESPRLKAIVQDIGKLLIVLTYDNTGTVIKSQSDLRLVPKGSRDVLDDFSGQMQQSIDLIQVSVPPGQYVPGKTWTAPRKISIETVLTDTVMADIDMTYQYKGLKVQQGRQVAVVSMVGKLRGIKGRSVNLEGQATGVSHVDLMTGRVLGGKAILDITLDLSFRGESIRSKGTLEVSLARMFNQ